jgi:hypothetical protein
VLAASLPKGLAASTGAQLAGPKKTYDRPLKKAD